jgi:hypothetical protein
MKRNTIVLSTIVLLATVFSSCEKVIDINLNDSEPVIVIEGEITTVKEPYLGTVSESKNFDEDNTFKGRPEAVVTIQDVTSGVSEILLNRGGGAYQTSVLQGVMGHTYTLTVTLDGKVYAANSTIPPKAVKLQSLYAEYFSLDDDDIFMVPQYTDPAGKGNYYRIRQYVNGEIIKGSFVRSDDATDGLTYSNQLFYQTDAEAGNPRIRMGDKITAELQCVDKGVYDYFRTLATTVDQDAATPSNPLTNFTGGALGVFNACSTDFLTAEVKL